MFFHVAHSLHTKFYKLGNLSLHKEQTSLTITSYVNKAYLSIKLLIRAFQCYDGNRKDRNRRQVNNWAWLMCKCTHIVSRSLLLSSATDLVVSCYKHHYTSNDFQSKHIKSAVKVVASGAQILSKKLQTVLYDCK